MLQSIRDRAQGLIVWVIIGFIILTFALWGVNEYFQGDSGVHVATVDGDDISQAEYQRAYMQERARLERMLGSNFNSDVFDARLKTSALDNVIDTHLLTRAAHDSGLRVSEAQLAEQIRSIEPFQAEGKFSKVLYEQQLRAQGETPKDFERRLNQALLADQIIQGITTSGFATKSEIETKHKLEQQQRSFGYFKVPVEDFKKGISVSDAEVKEYYDKNQNRFQTPALVNIEYVELAASDLAAKIQVDDAELKKYYEEQQARFTTPEERRASHILIPVAQDADAAAVEAAKKTADDIHARVVKGEQFAELAKKFSKDPGSASAGGDLGFFGKGVMDAAFEKAAFKLQKGEISEPVRSRFGYHIIKVTDIRAETVKPFEAVKNEVAQEVRGAKAERQFFEATENLANLAFENADTLQPAAQALGLEVKSTGFFPRSGGPGIAADPKIAAAAFDDDAIARKLNSEPIEVEGGRVVVVRVKDYQAASTRPLADVRNAIVNELTLKKAQAKAQEQGEALVKEIAAGKNPTAVAAERKYKWEKVDAVKRDDTRQNAELLRKVFQMAKPAGEKPAVDGVGLSGGDYAVIALTDVKDGDVQTLDAAAKGTLQKNLSNADSFGAFQALMKEIRDKADVVRYPNNL